MHRAAIAYALASAVLFGASTPLAKLLVGEMAPLVLAGVLYLGSGVGLLAWIVLRGSWALNLSRRDLPWLAGAIAAGGVVGPITPSFRPCNRTHDSWRAKTTAGLPEPLKSGCA